MLYRVSCRLSDAAVGLEQNKQRLMPVRGDREERCRGRREEEDNEMIIDSASAPVFVRFS